MVVAIVSLLGTSLAFAKDTNTIINNNIRSSANTGGNYGENIITGNASAEASVKNKINGTAEKTKIKTNASAEANGEKVEAQTESADGEKINIIKEATEDGTSASISIQAGQTSASDNLQNYADKKEVAEQESIVTKVANAVKSLFSKLLSIFS